MNAQQTGIRILRPERKQLVPAGLVLLLLMTVSGYAFVIGAGFMESPIIPVLAAGVVAAAVVPVVRGRAQTVILIILGLLTLLAISVFHNMFRNGLLQMVNMAIAWYNRLHGSEHYYFVLPSCISQQLAAHLMVCLLLLLLGYLFAALLQQGRTSIFTALCLLPIGLVLLLKAEPAYTGCCFLIPAIPGGLLWAGAKDYGAKQLTVYLTVLLLLGFGLSAAYMQWGTYTPNQKVSDMKESAEGRLDAFRFGEEDTYTGSLEKAATFDGGTTPRLHIGASTPGTYYLRGFIGGTYQGGAWEEIDPSKYVAFREGLFTWLKKRNFMPLSQNSDYLRLLMSYEGQDPDSRSVQISVVNVGANRRYTYSPYGLQRKTVEALQGVNHDMNVYWKGEHEEEAVTFDADLFDMSTSLTVINPGWMRNASISEEAALFREAQEEYRDFVYDSYLEQDPELKQFFSSSLKPVPSEETATATIEIRKWLADENTADGSLGSRTQTDYLWYFLSRDRRANSSFYASAAVMMFRYYGIPARYAEGYLGNITKKDTTSVDHKLLQKYQKELTGEDVHAWAEVYRDGIGWVPVEVTPGFYDDLEPPKTQSNKKPLPPQVKPPKQDVPKPVAEDGGNGFWRIHFLRVLALILSAFVLILIVVVLARRIRILHRRNRSFAGDDMQAAMQELLPWLRRILQIQERTEDTLPQKMKDILRPYRFRDGTITQESFAMLLAYARSQLEAVWKASNAAGKFRILFLWVLK